MISSIEVSILFITFLFNKNSWMIHSHFVIQIIMSAMNNHILRTIFPIGHVSINYVMVFYGINNFFYCVYFKPVICIDQSNNLTSRFMYAFVKSITNSFIWLTNPVSQLITIFFNYRNAVVC